MDTMTRPENECLQCGWPTVDGQCTRPRCAELVAAQAERQRMIATRTCPTCKRAGALSKRDVARGHHCADCTGRDERNAGTGF